MVSHQGPGTNQLEIAGNAGNRVQNCWLREKRRRKETGKNQSIGLNKTGGEDRGEIVRFDSNRGGRKGHRKEGIAKLM